MRTVWLGFAYSTDIHVRASFLQLLYTYLQLLSLSISLRHGKHNMDTIGRRTRAGDVVGCGIDVDARRIMLWLNGEFVGVLPVKIKVYLTPSFASTTLTDTPNH